MERTATLPRDAFCRRHSWDSCSIPSFRKSCMRKHLTFVDRQRSFARARGQQKFCLWLPLRLTLHVQLLSPDTTIIDGKPTGTSDGHDNLLHVLVIKSCANRGPIGTAFLTCEHLQGVRCIWLYLPVCLARQAKSPKLRSSTQTLNPANPANPTRPKCHCFAADPISVHGSTLWATKKADSSVCLGFHNRRTAVFAPTHAEKSACVIGSLPLSVNVYYSHLYNVSSCPGIHVSDVRLVCIKILGLDVHEKRLRSL